MPGDVVGGRACPEGEAARRRARESAWQLLAQAGLAVEEEEGFAEVWDFVEVTGVVVESVEGMAAMEESVVKGVPMVALAADHDAACQLPAQDDLRHRGHAARPTDRTGGA